MENFVYPLIRTEDDNIDLKYSLRALERNFREPFSVTIIGHLPSWLDVSKIRYVPFNDTDNIYSNSINKLVVASIMYKDFIYIHDDMIILKPVKKVDLGPFYVERFNGMVFGSEPYQQELKYIYKMLKSSGIKIVYNFATHTPFVFHGPKVLHTIYMYQLQNNPRLFFENFYYNNFPNNKKFIGNKRLGIYDKVHIDKNMLNSAYFLNFNEYGKMNSNVSEVLGEMFNEKSSFEFL